MSFAAEMKDFVSAFSTVSNILGTPESREGERLDNEYRRATIDWTRARIDEIRGPQIEFGTELPGLVEGQGWDRPGAVDSGGVAKVADAATPGDYVPSILSPAGKTAPPRPGIDITPPARPSVKTAAVGDDDVIDVASGSDTMVGDPRRDTLAAGRSYELGIIDKTNWNLQPRALKIADAMGITARKMGIELVATAGSGGGHKSHSRGTETDWMGYKLGPDGKRLRQWNPSERATIAASGGSVGANRFGLYPGGSLHVGYSSSDPNVYRPAAVWGASGILKGPSARNFRNPADMAFLRAFQSGRLYGADPSKLVGGKGDGFPSYRGGGTLGAAREAIASIESMGSGGYAARNGNALGRYQVMASNLPSWSKQALGRSVSAEEFMANPAIQDKIFNYQFGKLVSKYGNLQDAASAWFTGRPLGGGGAGASDGNITGQEYVNRFNAALGSAGGDYAGGEGGAAGVGGIRASGGGSDELIAPYPEARTKDDAIAPPPAATPEARAKDDVISPTAAAPVPLVHEVVEGDTLWDLSKRYNLDSYMAIVEANPDIIEDPDLIYPGEKLVIPGGVGEDVAPEEARTKDDFSAPDQRDKDDLEANVPTPRGRPPGDTSAAYRTSGEAAPQGTSAAYRPGAVEADTTRAPYNLPTPPPRPDRSSGATSVYGTEPVSGSSAAYQTGAVTGEENIKGELQLAYDRRDEISASDRPADVKGALIRAVNVKIASLEQELGIGIPGRAAGGTPFSSDRPTEGAALAGKQASDYRSSIQARGVSPGAVDEATSTFYNEMRRGAIENPRRDGVLAPTAAEEPISGTDMSAVSDDVISADEGSDTLAGGPARDEMSPAETSIREVTDAWDITPTGHVMRPDGREYPDDTFTAGREGALRGKNWLANAIFGDGVEAVDLEEDAAPDDGTPDAVDLYHSGKLSVNASQYEQAKDAVRGWAAKNGVTLTNSELETRAIGAVYSFWMMRDPDKAEKIAASIMKLKQLRYNQYSAIAKAALEAGDTEKAVEAAVAAYAEIPDGRDFDVTGDASTGYTVRYSDEETGKVLTEKVLSPDQMFGMIFNMAPGDVDKFLVKAAGQDALPEASPELTKFLADLEATPEGTRPVLDAALLAQMDSRNAQIALEAMRNKMAIYDEQTGGEAGRAGAGDLAALEKIAAGLPGAGGAAAAAPAAPVAGAPAAGAPEATAPTTGTPVTDAGAVSGAGSPDTLLGGTKSPVVAELVRGFPKGTEVAPGVYDPGPDQTFGVGSAIDVMTRVKTIMSMNSQQGVAGANEIFAEAEKVRQAEINRRSHAYYMLYANTGGPPAVEDTEALVMPKTGAEPRDDAIADPLTHETFSPYGRVPGATPPIASGSLYDVPGTMPVPRQTITQAEKDPTNRNVGLAPPSVPLPIETMASLTGGTRPQLDGNMLAALANDDGATAAYKQNVQNAQERYDQLETVVKEEYAKAIKLPEARPFTREERDDLGDKLETVPTENVDALGGEEGVKHLIDNRTTFEHVAQTVGEMNALGVESAVDVAMGLISVNPKKPTVPNFIAVPHPRESQLMVVQMIDGDTPDGPKLLMPKDVYETVVRTWAQRAEVVQSQVPTYGQDQTRNEDFPTRGTTTQFGYPSKFSDQLPAGTMGNPADLRKPPSKTAGQLPAYNKFAVPIEASEEEAEGMGGGYFSTGPGMDTGNVLFQHRKAR